jgi:hypothetical protein
MVQSLRQKIPSIMLRRGKAGVSPFFLILWNLLLISFSVYTEENGVSLMLILDKRKSRRRNSLSKGLGSLSSMVREASSTTKHQVTKAIELILDPDPKHSQEIGKVIEVVNRQAATQEPEMGCSTGHRTEGRDRLRILLDSRSLELQRHHEIKRGHLHRSAMVTKTVDLLLSCRAWFQCRT